MRTPSKILRRISSLAAFAVALGSTSAFATNPVPAYDPSKPVDLNRYTGGERPQQNDVLNAFSKQFDALTVCVEKEKQRIHQSQDERMLGDATMTVLLNPHGARPLGVNAVLPKEHQNRREMTECLRRATWMGSYPQYDGPPIVVDFEFELDAGYDWVEE